MRCEYGCEREAKFTFKNGRQCCENNIAKCPNVKEKNSKSKIGKVGHPHSEETKIKMSEKQKGRIITKEAREKISKAKTGKKMSDENREKLKGRIPWNKGKTNVYSDETRRNISESLKGHPSPRKGIPRTEQEKENISKACIGRPVSEEAKIKIGLAHLGRKRSIETREKMRQSKLGDKSNFWMGGISRAKYDNSFNKILKELIKQRDNF